MVPPKQVLRSGRLAAEKVVVRLLSEPLEGREEDLEAAASVGHLEVGLERGERGVTGEGQRRESMADWIAMWWRLRQRCRITAPSTHPLPGDCDPGVTMAKLGVKQEECGLRGSSTVMTGFPDRLAIGVMGEALWRFFKG
ncbi:hypothetical protein VTN77DRAFT_5793 [Rasamsonia byssochlamydoides]|uniref:uncharacterized protein n=1 Tax=Rasamsonia byssochlamydoides TaxID=89139 RepID=UPI0037425474